MTDMIRTGPAAPHDDAPWTDEDAARLNTLALPSVGGPAGAPPGYPGRVDPAGNADQPPASAAAGAVPEGAVRPAASVPSRTFTRARTGLIVLVAFVVELVVVAAGANQAMTKHLARYATDHPVSFPGHAAHAALVYGWRFTPRAGGLHLWWGELTLLGTVFVLGALLTAVLVRGVVTFWRALVGIWLAVLVATVAGVIAGSVVAATGTPLTSARVTDIVFTAPTPDAVLAGSALGLVTAFVASIVAVATRRRITVEIPAAELAGDDGPRPDDPEPFFGSPAAAERESRPRPAARESRPRLGIGATNPDDYPAFTASSSRTTTNAAPDGTVTTEFPKPPDDEDLGHQPD